MIMNDIMKQLSLSAQKLSKNPLGIIALFIILIYAFASLVVCFSSNLDGAQKTPLIWFLVVFPLLVLGVFAWLVAYHHTKLYAPHDFPDKEGFFRALTPSEQKQRLNEEIKEVKDDNQESEVSRILSEELQKNSFVDV